MNSWRNATIIELQVVAQIFQEGI